MTTATVKIQHSVNLTYDEGSEQFQEALKCYQEVINEDGSAQEMLEQIAAYLVRTRDYTRMIEGVGYVRCRGRCVDEELFCGVEVDTDDPDCEVEFEIVG